MSLFDDLRFGARVLGKKPGTTALIVLLLAAGIGVNTTVFTLVNAVLIKGLPYEEGERILYLEAIQEQTGRDLRASLPDFLDWRASTKTFEGLAAYNARQVNLADAEGTPERVDGAEISVDGFRVLRVEPILGRGFLDSEREPNAPAVALIGYSLWEERYGAKEDVIGRKLRVNQEEKEIVGVMPADFRFPANTDVWTPLVERSDAKRGDRNLGVYGRLADGVTPGEAKAEMAVIGRRIAAEHPDTNEDLGVAVLTFNENFNGGEIRTVFLAMLGAVGFVLLIACANVANIQLARAMDRAREMSVRAALGAGKMRIFRQLLAESLLLAFAGGALGLGLAAFGVRQFDLATRDIRPFFIDFSFDPTIFVYLLGICLLTGVVFGLAPALHAVRADIGETLKEGRGQTAGSRTRFFASSMVIGEVALATILLVGAGLMMHSFWYLYHLDSGADTTQVLTAAIDLPESQYPDAESRLHFHERLLEEALAAPGVTAAATGSHEPLRGAMRMSFEREGDPPIEEEKDRPTTMHVMISPGYFDVFRMRVLEGRGFGPLDTPEAPKRAVVNRTFADKYWPEGGVVGGRIRLDPDEDGVRGVLEIVGVCADVRVVGQGEIEPVVYRLIHQESWQYSRLLLRTEGDPAAAAPALREIVASIDPDLPVFDVSTMEERLARGRWQYRVFGSLFGVFALVALAMSAAGIYGLVAYSVGRRTSEFGIRLALGASPPDILRLVLRQGMARVAVGAVLGVTGAYFAARVLEGIVAGIEPTNPMLLSGSAVFLAAVAGVACWIPARRAAGVSPSAALRAE